MKKSNFFSPVSLRYNWHGKPSNYITNMGFYFSNVINSLIVGSTACVDFTV